MDSIAQIIGYIVIIVIVAVPWVIGAISIWERFDESDDD